MATWLEQWQKKLDDEFPDGLIVTWDVPSDDHRSSVSYQIPRAEVIGQAGLDPVVDLPVFGIDKMLTVRVLHYEVKQRVPCFLAIVTVDNPPNMRWSAGVEPLLARRMSDQRAEFLDYYTATGRSIFS